MVNDFIIKEHDMHIKTMRKMGLFLMLSVCLNAGTLYAQSVEGKTARKELLVKMVRAAMENRSGHHAPPHGEGVRKMPLTYREIARALRRNRLDVSFKKQSVADVLKHFHKVTGLNFVISAKAGKKLEADRANVSLELKNLPLKNILQLLTVQLGDYIFTVKSSAIVLRCKAEFKPRKILRIYDVRDILHGRKDFPGPKLNIKLLDDEQRR